MMECEKVQEILPAYLEGLAPSLQSENVALHLASCAACSTVVRALIRSRKMVRNLKEREPPLWLKERIMARLDEAPPQEEKAPGTISRLKQFLFHPARVKIPIQAFAVLTLAAAAVFAYRSPHPLMDTAQKLSPPVPPGQKEALTSPTGKPAVHIFPPYSPEQSATVRKAMSESTNWSKVPPGFGQESRPRQGWPGSRQIEDAKERDPQPAPVVERTKEDLPKSPDETTGSAGEKRVDVDKGKPVSGGQEVLALSIQPSDVATGSKEIEALLRDVNAPAAREGAGTFRTEVPQQKAKEVLRRLSALGAVRQRGILPETPADKTVTVTIQIIQKQP